MEMLSIERNCCWFTPSTGPFLSICWYHTDVALGACQYQDHASLRGVGVDVDVEVSAYHYQEHASLFCVALVSALMLMVVLTSTSTKSTRPFVVAFPGTDKTPRTRRLRLHRHPAAQRPLLLLH